jgi:hypothetical protein
MSGPRAPHSLRHEPQSTPLKFEEPVNFSPKGKMRPQLVEPERPFGHRVPPSPNTQISTPGNLVQPTNAAVSRYGRYAESKEKPEHSVGLLPHCPFSKGRRFMPCQVSLPRG